MDSVTYRKRKQVFIVQASCLHQNVVGGCSLDKTFGITIKKCILHYLFGGANVKIEIKSMN